MKQVKVRAYQVGLVFKDGVFEKMLPEGNYWFWRRVDVYFDYYHPSIGTQFGFVTFESGDMYKEFCLGSLYDDVVTYIDYTQCNDAPSFICGDAPLPSLCREDPRYAFFSKKIRRYNEYVDMSSTVSKFSTEEPDFVDDKTAEMNTEALSNCEAQADIWINALKGCVGTPVELDTLRARLIAICQQGSTPANLGGTSDGQGLGDDFEAAIRSVFPNASEACTAELIANPYPHNRQPLYERGIYLQIEPCLQSRFNELKGYYLGSGYTGSFHQWLQKQLKGDYKLTETELTSLETQLSSGCRYLKKPLELPVAMSCSPNNSGPSCIDSASMVTLLADFNTKYPNIDDTHENYEVLLTNYLNHRLAFALNYEDYQGYIDKMQTGTVNKDMLCARSQLSYLDGVSEVNNCLSDVFFVAYSEALTNYTAYIDSVRTAFRMNYFEKCLNGAAFLEMKSNYLEYHYTLYYYDQSGNLVKTVPPKGVEVGTVEQIQQTQQYRINSDKSCFTNQPYVAFTGSNLVNVVPASSYISQLNSPNVTVEAFIKLNDFSNQGIFSLDTLQYGMYQNGFSLFIRNNKLVVRSGLKAADQGRDMSERETAVVSNFMETGRWYHVAIAFGYPSDQIFLYIDGMKTALTALDSNIPYFGNDGGVVQVPIKLGGAYHNGTIDYMQGDMRQFRMYKRVLSQGEIVKNASNECLLPSNPTELWAYVPLYEGIGNAMDYTNGYIGVASSGTIPWTNYVPPYYPAHSYATLYEYNSFNQVVKQQTPDADSSRFWYDILGRLIASQNEEQRNPKNTYSNPNTNRYSYTRYDAQGRITEVGEKRGGGQMSDNVAKSVSLLSYWFNNTGTDYDVTQTYYDNPATTVVPHTNITDLQALNSRKRVVTTLYKEAKSNNYYDQATHYVYDISGNVKTQFEEVRSFMQDLPVAARYPRRIDYDYDLISGKVNKVSYEKGKGDQFYHKFEYDPENRITGVFSSRDDLRWENEARYYYYLHGPLARVELGERKVQGVDYAYTLQGWLKGINSQILDPEEDMAGDGLASSPLFKNMSRDVYGFSIGYHGDDYQPIGTTTAPAFGLGFTAPTGQVGTSGNTGYELFNGNIRNTTLALSTLNNGATVGYSYLYDQLNRLTATKQHTISGSSWSYSSFGEAYRERTTYDANGNILRYLRQGANISGQPKDMDSLTYHYLAGTNKLNYVHDAVSDANYGADIDLKNQSVDNYDYDRIGNLMSDAKGNADHISWNVYGKIRSVVKTNGDTISYGYNSAGNRVEKRVAKGSVVNRYIYIRDAQGNVLSVYRDSSDVVNLEEQHLYGSARLGMWKYGQSLPPDTVPSGLIYDSSLIGSKEFELTNHLGNVLSVISDKKVGVEATGGLVDYYKSEVLNQQDFYPFGMRQPNRIYSVSDGYRYGFNGKENDNEIKGGGNQIDYGSRVYDTRLGKFLSIDPLTKDYAQLTPYQFASNSPIANIDLDGEESKYFNVTFYEFYDSKGRLQTSTTTRTEDKSKEVGALVSGFKYLFTGDKRTGTSYVFHKEIDRIDKYGKVTSEKQTVFEIYIPGEGDKRKGGLYLVSKSGGYGHADGELTGKDAEPISLDGWLGFLGSTRASITTRDLAEDFSKNQEFIKGIQKIFQIIDANEKVEDLTKGIQKYLKENEKKYYPPSSNVCSSCGASLPDSRGEDHGLDVYRTDREGNVIDTIRQDPESKKRDTIPSRKK